MDFSARLLAYQKRVDATLRRQLAAIPSSRSPLVDAMEYALLSGGKRLRPYLVYATGEMLGVSVASLDNAAAAIECVHAYSLIHDDLPAMDNGTLRRGLPSCHIKFGESTAILAGDALQALAFSLLADVSTGCVSSQAQLSMIAELASASGAAGICLGQTMDLASQRQIVDLDTLESIHLHKTGVMIRAAVRLGAYAAEERAQKMLPHLDRYAEAVGLAFQIQDDILDVIGEAKITGKRQGTDQQLGKNTYPTLMGLKGARERAQALCKEAFSTLAILAEVSYDTSALIALTDFIIERDN